MSPISPPTSEARTPIQSPFSSPGSISATSISSLTSLLPPIPSPITVPTSPIQSTSLQLSTLSPNSLESPPLPDLLNTKLSSHAWSMQQSECNSQLFIYKIQEEPSSSSQPLKLSHSVTIRSDLSVRIVIHGHELNSVTCDSLSIPEQINVQTLTALLLEIEKLNVCPGHPDKQFVHMANEDC